MFEAFQLGPFLFRSHLLFLLLGVWLASELFLRLAVAEGLPVAHFLRRAPFYLLAFLLGGRILAVLLLYRAYLQDPFRIFVFWDGGFTFIGGCIGVGILLFLSTFRERGTTFLQWLDALMPAVMLGESLDWLGRFFGNLSYGKPTDVFFGITVESMAVRYTVPIHPVQLYYAAYFLGVTYLLLRLRKRESGRAGFVTLVSILASAFAVLLFESFRGDFAITVFAKLSDFFFLAALFASLGMVAVLEQRLSPRYSIMNSVGMGLGTAAYILLRPWIAVASIEWRFSQFLTVLAVIGTVVYVVVHRWKYPHL